MSQPKFPSLQIFTDLYQSNGLTVSPMSNRNSNSNTSKHRHCYLAPLVTQGLTFGPLNTTLCPSQE